MEMIFWSISVLLPLFHYLWLKGGFPVLWHSDLHASIAAVDLFLFVAVAVVIIVGTLGFAVAKMVLHFCFHHFFDGSAKQIF